MNNSATSTQPKGKAESVKTLRNGALQIEILKYGDGRFGFEWNSADNDRKQVRLKTLGKAEEKARELLGATRAGTVDLLRIDPLEYAEFLRWRAERRRSVPVPDLAKLFLASKKTKGRSSKHLRGLKHSLDKFAEAFPMPIDKLTRRDVEKWLDSRNVGPRRWNNLLADIIALIRFARRDGILPADATPVELIERRTVEVEVTTYTPEELSKLLNAAWKEWLPSLVFGAFCGLRPEELYPEKDTGKRGLHWENVLWSKGKIDVPAEVSKTRRRRFAPLTEAAQLWLARWRDAKGPVAHDQRFWAYVPRLTKLSGVEWKPDALRHSFASYRLAITNDIQSLALEMGNSPTMIHRHYLDLKHEDEAQRWFAVDPKRP